MYVAYAVCVAMISAQKTPVRQIVSSRKIPTARHGLAFRSSVRVSATASATRRSYASRRHAEPCQPLTESSIFDVSADDMTAAPQRDLLLGLMLHRRVIGGQRRQEIVDAGEVLGDADAPNPSDGCPVYPDKRRKSRHSQTSLSCHKRPSVCEGQSRAAIPDGPIAQEAPGRYLVIVQGRDLVVV